LTPALLLSLASQQKKSESGYRIRYRFHVLMVPRDVTNTQVQFRPDP
jgi:hypothetical protein